MKVTFPKNIKKGILSWMSLNVWPISITIVQLFLVALWVGLALATFSAVSKTGTKAAGLLFAIPVLIIFIVIAFFKVSEMWILEYISKLVRNKFFDVQKKYQENFEKQNETEISIKEAEQVEQTQIIEQKIEDKTKEKDIIKEIEKWWLI